VLDRLSSRANSRRLPLRRCLVRRNQRRWFPYLCPDLYSGFANLIRGAPCGACPSSWECHVGACSSPVERHAGRVPHPWSAMRGRVPHPGSAGALAGPSPFYVTRIGPCPRWHLRRGKSQSTASCETLPARAPALPGGLTRMATLGFTTRPTCTADGSPGPAAGGSQPLSRPPFAFRQPHPWSAMPGACPSPWERRRPHRPITLPRDAHRPMPPMASAARDISLGLVPWNPRRHSTPRRHTYRATPVDCSYVSCRVRG